VDERCAHTHTGVFPCGVHSAARRSSRRCGESAVGFMTVTAGLAQVNAGRIRALGVSSPQRLPLLPNVPTIA
jgi:tripartite-type tricarboxylate transporter receptor subunit TctC